MRIAYKHFQWCSKVSSQHANSDLLLDMGVAAAVMLCLASVFFFPAAVPRRKERDNNKYISAPEGERKWRQRATIIPSSSSLTCSRRCRTNSGVSFRHAQFIRFNIRQLTVRLLCTDGGTTSLTPRSKVLLQRPIIHRLVKTFLNSKTHYRVHYSPPLDPVSQPQTTVL
jgi:hypothetical protein